MFDFFKKSLANRLLFSFFIIGFLPFVIFLVYTLVLSETQIVKKLIVDQHHEVEVMDKLINTHLNTLSKEVLFLAKLEIMDDLIAEDIDKRISRLLEQKKEDYALDLNFFLLNETEEIMASSEKNILMKKFRYSDDLKGAQGSFTDGKKLFFYAEVFASFEKEKSLGYLLLEYNLENLRSFLDHSKDAKAYIINTKNKACIGDNPNLKILIKGDRNSLNIDNYLVVYKKMDGFLKEWTLFYAVEKHKALAFFYNFIVFMLYLSPFILVLIVFISWKFSKYIVKPIKDLTQVTDEIVHTKDYSRYLDMVSQDEIGKLADSFNTLLNTTDKSLDASEAKSAFISNMSHELKTPLNAIIGFSQYLISYEKLTDEQLDIVSNIESSSQYLLEMIHGILDIAKIEAGKVDLDIQEYNCFDLVQECCSMLEPLAYDKGLVFEFEKNEDEIGLFKTDAKIFKQIVINLLSNAIKYTSEGRVIVSLSLLKNKINISITDTGIGIKEEEMSKLFKEFSRIDNGLSSQQKGTGLGLSLSKKLAHVLRGDIILESKGLGLGTKAIFVLEGVR